MVIIKLGTPCRLVVGSFQFKLAKLILWFMLGLINFEIETLFYYSIVECEAHFVLEFSLHGFKGDRFDTRACSRLSFNWTSR